jgi:hypothetical protein
MSAMKPLILTGWLVPEFTKSEFADLAVDFFFRFGWGELPSPDELAAYLGPRAPDVKRGRHWSDFASRLNQSKNRSRPRGGLQPAQPDRSVVGRYAPDQRSPLALESGADRALLQAV